MSFNAGINNTNSDNLYNSINNKNTNNSRFNNTNNINNNTNYNSFNQSNKSLKNSNIKIEDYNKPENQQEDLKDTNNQLNSDFNYKNFPYNNDKMKTTSLKNFPSSTKDFEEDEQFENPNKTNYFKDVNLNDFHSKIMLEPIIIKDYFTQGLQKELKKNKKVEELLDLKLLDYSVLKEIIDGCGSFPAKHRIYFIKFLLSLPNDNFYFDIINKKGLHPFFKNLEDNFDLKDKHTLNKLKNICSNLAYWSEEVGNVFFLPNIVFPFIKCFKGNDLFIFEALIALINCFCQYWFEYYPGAPLNHIKLCEKIIEKENPTLYRFFHVNVKKEQERLDKERFDIRKNLYPENHKNSTSDSNRYENNKFTSKVQRHGQNGELINIRITEICWKFMQSFFSESLDKIPWMQLLDYLACNSHRPEILLYINSALLLISDKLIMKCKNAEELYSLLFSQNLLKYPIANTNMLKVFNLANKLYEKYSGFQLYKYSPHIPFENGNYKLRVKFPLDFLGTTASIKEQIFHEENNIAEKKSQIELLENNFKSLLKKEQQIQRVYENMVHKEKEKAELMKRELELLLFKKNKINNELKEKKLEKIGRLQSVIDDSLGLYKKMNENEIKYFDEELKTRKILEECDMKARLQQEELNNLEIEANKKMFDMLNIRSKDELMQKEKAENFIREKERKFYNRLNEEKWKIEDEALKMNIDNMLNSKELNFLKLRDQNLFLEKNLQQKIIDFENKLYTQQVEKERIGRNADYNSYNNTNGLTSIEDNFLNSIGNLSSNKNYLNNPLYTNSSVYKQDAEFNNLIEDLRKNMLSLELEEKALIEYEQELNKKEFDLKINSLKHSNKPQQQQSSFNNSQNNSGLPGHLVSELNNLEAEKRNCFTKKQDLEARKAQLNENLNNLFNLNLKNSQASNNNYLNNQNNFSDTYGTNNVLSTNNNLNINSLNSMDSADLRKLEKENQIRQENEKLYKKMTDQNHPSSDKNHENNNYNNSIPSNQNEDKNLPSEAPTSKFPYENSFGNRSQNNTNSNNQNYNNSNQNTLHDRNPGFYGQDSN